MILKLNKMFEKTVFQNRPHVTGKFSSVINTANLPAGILFVKLKIGITFVVLNLLTNHLNL